MDDSSTSGGDALPLTYDPAAIAAYWSTRPVAMVKRVVQVLGIGAGFLSGVVSDLVQDKLGANDVLRARQLREILTSLGPAYIKIGQALSIRPDLLSPAAMNEMQKLCDKVSVRLCDTRPPRPGPRRPSRPSPVGPAAGRWWLSSVHLASAAASFACEGANRTA